jgi:hypothetical protein
MNWPTFEQWFAGLSTADQKRTRSLVALLKEMGAKDAESWARSEISENIAQTARFNVLNRLNRECVIHWSEPRIFDRYAQYDDKWRETLAALLSEGVSEELLVQFAKFVARSTLFAALCTLDEGVEPFGPGQRAPGWSLRETDSDGALTGRDVGGLHESFDLFREGSNDNVT